METGLFLPAEGFDQAFLGRLVKKCKAKASYGLLQPEASLLRC